jgi:glutathione S-transferase
MLLAAPAIILTAAVTLLAVLLTTLFAIHVSRTRRRMNVPPPAINGPADFERILRAHANTVESMVMFLPSLWLAALYFQGWWAPVLGLVWCLGRIVYVMGYDSAAEKRLPGFIISQLSIVVLWILAVIGVVNAWMAATAA